MYVVSNSVFFFRAVGEASHVSFHTGMRGADQSATRGKPARRADRGCPSRVSPGGSTDLDGGRGPEEAKQAGSVAPAAPKTWVGVGRGCSRPAVAAMEALRPLAVWLVAGCDLSPRKAQRLLTNGAAVRLRVPQRRLARGIPAAEAVLTACLETGAPSQRNLLVAAESESVGQPLGVVGCALLRRPGFPGSDWRGADPQCDLWRAVWLDSEGLTFFEVVAVADFTPYNEVLQDVQFRPRLQEMYGKAQQVGARDMHSGLAMATPEFAASLVAHVAHTRGPHGAEGGSTVAAILQQWAEAYGSSGSTPEHLVRCPVEICVALLTEKLRVFATVRGIGERRTEGMRARTEIFAGVPPSQPQAVEHHQGDFPVGAFDKVMDPAHFARLRQTLAGWGPHVLNAGLATRESFSNLMHWLRLVSSAVHGGGIVRETTRGGQRGGRAFRGEALFERGP